MFNFSIKTLRRSVSIAATATTLTAALTGCSASVAMDPAADSNNPRCAALTVRLPNEIDHNKQRTTTSQATAAWGSPAAILSRCGLPEVLASTLPCVTAGGVDWLVDATNAPNYRFISFGRKPATEVIVNSKAASGVQALDAIGFSLNQAIPADRLCVDPKS